MHVLSYEEFAEVIVNGRVRGNNVMPAFGMNMSIVCSLKDIYAYLSARADDAIGAGRPDKQAKPQEAIERDKACMGP